DVKENRAFIEFSQFFRSKNLRVPQVCAVDGDMDCYLLEDLGNTTLFDWLSTARREKEIPAPIIDFYKQSIEQLIQFQLKGQELDFSLCHPRSQFDKQSMMWDLHYFKYYFLKLAQISFDEQLLEDDFNRFSDFLLKSDRSEEHTSELQSRENLVCRLLREKKKNRHVRYI